MNNWISCDERMPEKSGEYLVAKMWGSMGAINTSVGIAFYDTVYNVGWAHLGNVIVTHWMPLPEPPRPIERKESVER